jgi:hypothetical protein
MTNYDEIQIGSFRNRLVRRLTAGALTGTVNISSKTPPRANALYE